MATIEVLEATTNADGCGELLPKKVKAQAHVHKALLGARTPTT